MRIRGRRIQILGILKSCALVSITSADKILQAIYKGTVYLDPAPKYVLGSPSETKRRSQWRVNDIATAVEYLYENTEVVEL